MVELEIPRSLGIQPGDQIVDGDVVYRVLSLGRKTWTKQKVNCLGPVRKSEIDDLQAHFRRVWGLEECHLTIEKVPLE